MSGSGWDAEMWPPMDEATLASWERTAYGVGGVLLNSVGTIRMMGGAGPLWLLDYLHPKEPEPRVLLDYLRWSRGDQAAGDRLTACFASNFRRLNHRPLEAYPA